jgi:hypothetical protein
LKQLDGVLIICVRSGGANTPTITPPSSRQAVTKFCSELGAAQGARRLAPDAYLVERHYIGLQTGDFRLDVLAAGVPPAVILFNIERRRPKSDCLFPSDAAFDLYGHY